MTTPANTHRANPSTGSDRPRTQETTVTQPDEPADLAAIAAQALEASWPSAFAVLAHDPADAMRPVVDAVLAEAAAQQWIAAQDKQLGIKWADFRKGHWEMDLAAGQEFAAAYVAAARALLGDAKNYSETKLEFDVKIAESPEVYTLVVQRLAPGALTPHEARQRAEEQRDEVLRIVAAWFVEANDVGGLDAGDLAWRLEQAGHPLPDTEESS